MNRLEELRRNLNDVTERIAAAARDAGRDPGEISLLPVTKFHPASDLDALASLGITTVGENREQEAKAKAAECPGMRIAMIGQIQTKKANSIARFAAEVHSLDSVKLARALDRGMGTALAQDSRTAPGEILPCYLQLSADGDPARGGVAEADLPELVEVVESAPYLDLVGLMVVPPLGSDADEVFSWGRGLVERYSVGRPAPLMYSAGMTGDMEKAIAHGSTLVRVGTAILGARPVA